MGHLKAETVRPEFISPFSVLHEYRINWTELPRGYQGLETRVGQLTDRDARVLKLLSHCRIATSAQLGKAFWQNPRTAAGRLKMLARFGVLTRHVLNSKRLTLVIYTLGPLGARLLNTGFHQWWRGQPVTDTLAQLVTTQMFLRMLGIGPATLYAVPPPFTGMIKMGQTEYAVVAVRNGDIDFARIRAARLLVVAETEKHLLRFASQIQAPVRFTTDERLFTLPIEQVFLRFNRETGKLEGEAPVKGQEKTKVPSEK